MSTLRALTVFAVLVVSVSPALAESPTIKVPVPLKRIPHVLPTAHEIANPELYWSSVSRRYTPPPLYMAPPDPDAIRPGEFEEMDATLIAVVNYGEPFTQMWVEMVDAYSQAGHTLIVVDELGYKTTLEGRFNKQGIDASSYSWIQYPLNAIWIRDYGPEFTIDPDGTRTVYDGNYSFRPLDDAIPLHVGASDWLNSDGSPAPTNSVEHKLAGGNFMTDGAGTCFFSKIIYGYEAPNGWTDEQVDDLMQEYLGCDQIITLQSICLDGTGHIDLYAKLMGPTSILLGEFPSDTYFNGDGTNQSGDSNGFCDNPQNPNDYQDQEDNLAILEATTNLDGEPWTITRMPMPEPFHDGTWWVYRSYLNSEIFNGHVAMPTYYWPENDETEQELLDMEADAIAAYETASPGVVVHAIDSDHIIPMAGAIHCISHEIPVDPNGDWSMPDTYCGDGILNGDEVCDMNDFGGLTCDDFEDFNFGNLRCGIGCVEIDTSGCTNTSSETDTDSDTNMNTEPDSEDDDCGCTSVGSRSDRVSLISSILGYLTANVSL